MVTAEVVTIRTEPAPLRCRGHSSKRSARGLAARDVAEGNHDAAATAAAVTRWGKDDDAGGRRRRRLRSVFAAIIWRKQGETPAELETG